MLAAFIERGCHVLFFPAVDRVPEDVHLFVHSHVTAQSRIIGAVRGAHSQLWGTITPVCSLYTARKYDRRFGTPAIV